MAAPHLSFEPVELREITLPETERRPLDKNLLMGFAVAFAALLASGEMAGIALNYFFQPAGVLMVLGGTLGATLVTTPKPALVRALRRLRQLARPDKIDRQALSDDVLVHLRIAKAKGMATLEQAAAGITNQALREGWLLVLDGYTHDDLEGTMSLRLRQAERQAESDAKVFESAGGFAPTIGVMGTVLGLLEVMRHFSDLAAVAAGIGTAFVSTLYGLGLANLILLPIANRIRAEAAESYEVGEMVMEAVLGLRDGLPPRIVRERLQNYVR